MLYTSVLIYKTIIKYHSFYNYKYCILSSFSIIYFTTICSHHFYYFFNFTHTSFNITFISSQYYHKTFPFFSKDVSSQNLNLSILIPNPKNISLTINDASTTTHKTTRDKTYDPPSPIDDPTQLSNYQSPVLRFHSIRTRMMIPFPLLA